MQLTYAFDILNLMKFFRFKFNFVGLAIIFLVILSAFFLRAQESISGNFLFLIDQGRDMIAVKQIVFDHKLTLIGPYTSLQGVFQGPLWYYLLSIPTVILSGNPVGGVWLMLFISMLVILISYWWIGKRFGITAGTITAVLFAFSPQAIAAATYAWNPHPMWFLVLLFIIFFYKSVKESKKFYLISLPLISMMFHFETALAVFIFFSMAIYLAFFNRRDILTISFAFGFILFLLFFTPQLLFDLRHDFLMTKSIFRIFEGSNQGLLITGEEKSYPLLLKSHIEQIVLNFRSAFPFEKLFKFVPFLAFILVFVAGIKSFTKRKKTKDLEFLKFLVTFSGILIFIIIFLYPFPIRSWFLTGMENFYILAAAISTSFFWKNKLIKVGFIIFALLVFYFSMIRIYSLYFNNHDFGGVSKVKGKLDAVDYIYEDADSKKFGLLIFTPPVYTYAYDYLIWWRGREKYEYIPPYEKKHETYLLMEPDPGRPTSYKGWLETVIKDGRVEKTVKLPSGFIIQKRIYE